VLGPEADAARLRVKGAGVHLALACEGNARHVALDPRSGAAGQVLACARALACVGAEAIGVTDGLNFGDPGDPEVLWTLSEAIDGIAQACVALGVPVVSGNVSLHNQTGDHPVLPTPMIGMVGVLPSWVRRVPSWLPREGLTVALLSARAPADPRAVALGGSLYLRAIHGLGRAGELAEIDLPGEVALHAALRGLVRDGAIEAARSVTDGGVAVALARFGLPAAGFGAPIGGAYVLSSGERTAATDVAFFGEGHGRALVAYAPDARAAVLRAAGGVHLLELGVARGDRLVVRGGADATIDVDVHELARAWARVLPEWLE
jgi:phosphoribosylformylglycinamidine synthase